MIVFFILGLFAATSFASSCETSTSTFTRDSSNVTSVVISSDVGLTVTLVEGDSFELSVSFYGRDSALSVCTELMVDGSTWFFACTHIQTYIPTHHSQIHTYTHRHRMNDRKPPQFSACVPTLIHTCVHTDIRTHI